MTKVKLVSGLAVLVAWSCLCEAAQQPAQTSNRVVVRYDFDQKAGPQNGLVLLVRDGKVIAHQRTSYCEETVFNLPIPGKAVVSLKPMSGSLSYGGAEDQVVDIPVSGEVAITFAVRVRRARLLKVAVFDKAGLPLPLRHPVRLEDLTYGRIYGKGVQGEVVWALDVSEISEDGTALFRIYQGRLYQLSTRTLSPLAMENSSEPINFDEYPKDTYVWRLGGGRCLHVRIFEESDGAKKPADFLKSVVVRNVSGDDSKYSVDKGQLEADCDFGTTPGQNKELSFELLDMPKGYRISSGSTAKLSVDKDQYHDIVIGVDISESGVAKVDAGVLDGCADIAVYGSIALGLIVLMVFIFGRRKVSDPK